MPKIDLNDRVEVLNQIGFITGFTTKCEQGYKIETHNNIMISKQIIDFDGIQLVSM